MSSQSRSPANVALPGIPEPPKTKQQKCPMCHASFHRGEHLRRHIALHTGEMQYQCPCGRAYSRSDALVRHLKVCQQHPDGIKGLQRAERAEKQSRIKRACDQCAKSKLKCDFRSPCNRCSSKFSTCEYAREGHNDLWSSYRIRQSSKQVHAPLISETLERQQVIDLPISPADRNAHSGQTVDLSLQPLTSTPMANDRETTTSEPASAQSLFDQTMFNCLQMAPATFDADYPNYPDDASFLLSEMTDQFVPFVVPHMPFMVTKDDFEMTPLQTGPHSPVNDGFSIARMDPVEAKCIEIRELLQNSKLTLSSEIISACITRRNLLLCSELYGKHFQRNFPIIHAPSFNLVEASPLLALAVMLTGACYSEGLLPLEYVTKLAMELLVVIGAQEHEYNMQMPPLSTIQASTILSAVLVCSRNELAYKFVPVHNARNISMMERACDPSSTEAIDSRFLAQETFDWQFWIDQESRRRVACEIFCQDMVSCVFQGRPPALVPLEMNFILPCYESCWEAKTALECLEELQRLPQQMTFSATMRHLRRWSPENPSTFEASAFGMHSLICGLHALVFQATQYEMDSFLIPEDVGGNCVPETGVLLSLRQDLSGPKVAAIADDAVSSQGSSMLKQVNNALNAWRTTWDNRYFRDFAHENRSFVSDPLPFWWLAKLYVSLHFHAPPGHGDTEFSESRVKGTNENRKIIVQSKIIGWLSKFRRQQGELDFLTENCLPKLMKPLHDT